jgi:hypothetical protein
MLLEIHGIVKQSANIDVAFDDAIEKEMPRRPARPCEVQSSSIRVNLGSALRRRAFRVGRNFRQDTANQCLVNLVLSLPESCKGVGQHFLNVVDRPF